MAHEKAQNEMRVGGGVLNPWSLTYDSLTEENIGHREALCALGNGRFVTRAAALDAGWDGQNYPGTYCAGLYDHGWSRVGGRLLEHEDLVNVPNWLPIAWRCLESSQQGVSLLSYRQQLDFRRGLLIVEQRVRDAAGRVTWTQERRLVHMGNPHLAAIELLIEPINWDGWIVVRSSVDGRVRNGNVEAYAGADGVHLDVLEASRVGRSTVLVCAKTHGTRLEVAVAARTQISGDGSEAPGSAHARVADIRVRKRVTQGTRVRVEKVASVFTAHDPAITDVRTAALRELESAPGFDALLASHEAAWARLWERFSFEIHDEPEITSTVRLHLLQVLQTISAHSADLDVSVPARGWHGEGYRGHVFWDELFVVPILLYRVPELVRALLLYRYRRLPEARRAAKACGYRGAMFPWRSASDGREVTERLRMNPRSRHWIEDNSYLQRHIGAAIVYNVWHYYLVTDDTEFLESYGAELLLEIARFWASLVVLDEQRGRYVIRGVVGPDEFHDAYPDAKRPGIDNNAYTNVMAVWSVQRALEALELVSLSRRRELVAQLDITAQELARWRDVTRRMFVPIVDGILQQFEGYSELADFPWTRYREAYGDIHRLDNILEAEADSPNRFQASKQADALMLFYLLSKHELSTLLGQLDYPFSDEDLVRNTQHYLRRTSHGSTLSRVVHAWVLARSDRSHSWQMLRQALGADLADVQGGTTPEGLHLGAMAATVDIFQRCYSGLEFREGALWLNPSLPRELTGFSMRVRYRQTWLELSFGQRHVRVETQSDARHPVVLRVAEQRHELPAGTRLEIELSEPLSKVSDAS
ncbi:MAG: glycoside hydrolase family 65 protein [Myxococcota bacterium]